MTRNFCLEQFNTIFSVFSISSSVLFPGDTKMTEIDAYCLVERKTLVLCRVRDSVMGVRIGIYSR